MTHCPVTYRGQQQSGQGYAQVSPSSAKEAGGGKGVQRVLPTNSLFCSSLQGLSAEHAAQNTSQATVDTECCHGGGHRREPVEEARIHEGDAQMTPLHAESSERAARDDIVDQGLTALYRLHGTLHGVVDVEKATIHR
eukprot:CAMPEP_0194754066 /NCGR_PEP_ID=MMETSP0323_2-20130528/8054_1 /TAXON_ID=2866 ORGANISM="Crypthecodinium cohnii, Strain Seligo" /NCGR_SAMPLE_ID=MMETSP0323_2 /ASSEMBLY_ACC=CAM_ASM_000346 /LENGTH=137 /DNA_ID=CAMNT_0039672365 /DNA_START=159 /DNA_END=573 /DNA_ORIENTATION=-